MSDTPKSLPGRREAFFETDAIDQLVTMMLEVATDHWVLRERVFVIEKAAEQLGIRLHDAVEAYQLTAADQQLLAAQRRTLIENIMRSVNRPHKRTLPMNEPP
ncbi:MAG: hypothetical protein JSR66_18140 [Proteobacteria bacterium]|nr:hypothetical protein [Pseudomonadota bacterium]